MLWKVEDAFSFLIGYSEFLDNFITEIKLKCKSQRNVVEHWPVGSLIIFFGSCEITRNSTAVTVKCI
jgi:hypothetical protein